MKLRANKPLRDYGIYELPDGKYILSKRSENLSFLFTFHGWSVYGPVDYRVSHGNIYKHGELTKFTDVDLVDTGLTAKPPTPHSHINLAEQ